jgi:hypothetical protein
MTPLVISAVSLYLLACQPNSILAASNNDTKKNHYARRTYTPPSPLAHVSYANYNYNDENNNNLNGDEYSRNQNEANHQSSNSHHHHHQQQQQHRLTSQQNQWRPLRI